MVCDVSDDGPCSKTSCNPDDGQCATAAIKEALECDDNDVCTSKSACASGICTGDKDKECDDSNPCTIDSCDPIAGCQKTPAEGDCDDGNPCSTDDACVSGACKGVEIGCNDGIDCTYDSCDEKTGQCTNTPTNSQCNDNEQCTDDICDKANGCTYDANVDAQCDDGDKCTNATCGKSGKCDQIASYNKTLPGCGCNTAADCKGGSACTEAKCAEGECKYDPAPMNGKACDTGNICDVAGSGKCDGGSCTAGKPKDCSESGDGKCMIGQCDAVNGNCVAKSKGDGDACDADGSKCTPADTCKGGTCIADVPKNCSDLDKACTQGICDKASGACEAKSKADGDPCDDGNFCTVLEKCKAGSCSGGSIKTCSEENDTCNTGKCDAEAGTCIKVPKPPATKCNDGKYCTLNEVCNAVGNCGSIEDRVCEGDANQCLVGVCDETKNACVKKTAANGAKCSDSNFCTQTDACLGGVCKGSNPKDCSNSSDQCNVGACTPTSGACGGAPKADGTSCNDGDDCTLSDKCGSGLCKAGTPKNCNDNNACTIGDSCTKGGICKPGSAKVCNDNNSCTADSCNKTTGACIYTAIIGCGGNCNSAADCKSDGNVCTTDTCTGGKCVYSNNTLACDDGSKCTNSDKCSGGVCKAGAPVICKTQTCKSATCTPSTGLCAYSVTPFAACNDGNSCTTGDSCSETGICSGKAVYCNDGKLCTTDKCVSGQCTFSNNTLSCSDGNNCTLSDKCSGGVCKSGSAVACKQDLTICTNHACSSKTGLCTAYAANDGSACEKGKYSSCYNTACGCKLGESNFGSKSTDILLESALDGVGGTISVGQTVGAGYDGYIVRMDRSRTVIWQQTVSGGKSTDLFKSVYKTPKGTWVAAGYRLPDGGSANVGWLVEFDINGKIIKQLDVVGGKANDYLQDVVVDSAGKVYAAGYSYSFGSTAHGWLVKVDMTAGKVEWQKHLAANTTKTYVFEGLYLDATYGRLTTVGYTSDTLHGSNDGLVAQWSTSGAFYWYSRFGGSGSDALKKVTYSYGYLWAAGYSYSSSKGSADGWAVRFDRVKQLDKPTYDVRYGGGSYDTFYNIMGYGSGTIVVGRKHDGKANRGWFMYLSSTGSKYYEHIFGASGVTSSLYDVQYIGSSVFHAVGSTQALSTDAFIVGTTYSGVKTCSSGEPIEKAPN